MRLYLSKCSCTATSPSIFLPTNQSSSFLTKQDSAFQTKLWEFGVLICMRMDQLGTKGGDFHLYKPAPLWLSGHTFPFLWKTDFLTELKYLRCFVWADQPKPEQTGTEWKREEQTSREQSCLVGEGLDPGLPSPRVVLHTCCFRSPAVSQLSCFAVNSFLFTTPQIGDSCWYWIVTDDHWLPISRWALWSW